MNILWFLLAWCQSDLWREQMRRGQLTPAERAQEEAEEAAARANEEKAERGVFIFFVAFLTCGSLLFALVH